MARLEIEFSKKAVKHYKKLPHNYKTFVDLAFLRLADGMPTDLKPIQGEENTYRIRIGKYRILFEIIQSTVLVMRIGSRGDVYK
ncbi:MAG: type II toxin-antitoxin system RelE/ParE family toxin [Nitrospirae bacterium]|nr:MAG: type II toxin-antitoxin system RelE/ParE family toxin [Nitrospirota bacterium]